MALHDTEDIKTRFPQIHRNSEVSDQIHPITQFLEYADYEGWRLARYDDDLGGLSWTRDSMDLVFEMFDIDRKELDRERNTLLNEIREAQN